MRDSLAEELQKYSLCLPLMQALSVHLQIAGNLRGQKVGWHCHLTEITAAAAKVIVEAGASLYLSECNPDTTSEGAVKFMRELGAQVYTGPNSCLDVLENKPAILSDTGLVLTRTYLDSCAGQDWLFAASEITTSGISALRALDVRRLAVVNINAGELKSYIENFHGVGDGVIDGLFQLTGRLWSGRTACVIGYGKVGAGVAHYLRRAGAVVTVVEQDPTKRLIAHYDGYATEEPDQALPHSQLVVTATGRSGVIDEQRWQRLPDGALVMNVGHWSTELDLAALQAMATARQQVRDHLEAFTLPSGKTIYVVAEGSPANVVLLSGSPEPTLIHLTTEILCMNYLLGLHETATSLPAGEAPLPPEVEREASLLALRALKVIE